jgi:ribose transport system ATP-binding protein
VSGAVCTLEVLSVSKSYGATVALQDVSIELRAGEVHALLGENGAGKSTLVKILSGVVKPNAGTMRMGAEPYEPRAIVEARRRGVATAFQELSLVPNLTVAQNLSLPRQAKGRLGLISGAATHKQDAAILKRFGLPLSPSAIVASLTLAERQRLEITRAFAGNPKVLILDEPTAALAETGWLLVSFVRRPPPARPSFTSPIGSPRSGSSASARPFSAMAAASGRSDLRMPPITIFSR